MSRMEALQQYQRAVRLGQKCYRADLMQGRYPYPQVLDEILDTDQIAGTQELGLIEIPADQIVGTKTAGRKSAFASNFMPLLHADTEFALKWQNLCEAHLGNEGIRDPIRCFEYLGRFYVQEGNKRVSVLRSYEAGTIPGHVTRLVPPYSDDPQIQLYYEFMAFYQLSRMYQVCFTRPGCYGKLQAALGFDADHIWTQDERRMFLSRFTLFRNLFEKAGGRELSLSAADALLVWLRVYPLSDLRDMTAGDLQTSLQRIWPDLLLLTEDTPVSIQTEPQPADKGRLSQLFSPKHSHLNVAFIFQSSANANSFTHSHELGAEYVSQQMGDKIDVRCYYDAHAGESGDRVMEQAVADGAQVLVATAPPLIGACRKIAARHPHVKVLTCALSLPYAGVRTYYSRIHEAKFITGALSAAMAKSDRLGYVANYPILGVPAGINAFALGARMVNPDVRVQLEWSCLPGYPYEAFAKNGVRVITNREIPSPEKVQWSWDWGTYFLQEGGAALPIASPCWNWGRFYEQMLSSILNGTWDAVAPKDGAAAVGYWWGLSSGVIDVQFGPDLPDGIRRLGEFLKQGIISGSLNPFGFRLIDQKGVVHSDGDRWLSPAEIMNMDWLCDCVDGEIPAFEAMKPVSRDMVRVLGVYRDKIPPEKEAVIL